MKGKKHLEVPCAMSNFGGLNEWRKHIEERTKAIRERQQGAQTADTEGDSISVSPSPDVEDGRPASEEVEEILQRRRALRDEIQTIEEPAPEEAPDVAVLDAAALFALLPRHIQLLVRPVKQEVAQNSYKSKFSESREELIGRVLNPQLTLEETARVLNVCPTTVRRYTNRGLLKQERTPGNHRRFRLSDVLEFLEGQGGQVSD
jgi:excisionase family DNA binding protein